jgi:N-acetyl-anhydromuramyl-L-alanine amidase AmpD
MVDLSESIDFNYLGTNQNKKQIIITETKRDYKNYINALKYRYNKKNTYLPNFIVTKEGEIYKILDSEKYSNYMQDQELDKNAIIIALENHGWLKKNALDNTFLNWVGDIYKKEVFEKKWRDQLFWDPYNEKQIEELSKLTNQLCEEFNIPKTCIDSNVRQDGVENFRGIVTKSNFDFIHKDVNPSFNFKLFKKNLENEQSI